MGTRIKEHHRGKIRDLLDPDTYAEGVSMATTKEMVECLMRGSSDPTVRPPLPKAAANNVVRSVRKEQGLYDARKGDRALETNYRIQEETKRHREAQAAIKAAAAASAAVKEQNDTVEAEAPQGHLETTPVAI